MARFTYDIVLFVGIMGDLRDVNLSGDFGSIGSSS
jgi:hypothetical protein